MICSGLQFKFRALQDRAFDFVDNAPIFMVLSLDVLMIGSVVGWLETSVQNNYAAYPSENEFPCQRLWKFRSSN